MIRLEIFVYKSNRKNSKIVKEINIVRYDKRGRQTYLDEDNGNNVKGILVSLNSNYPKAVYSVHVHLDRKHIARSLYTYIEAICNIGDIITQQIDASKKAIKWKELIGLLLNMEYTRTGNFELRPNNRQLKILRYEIFGGNAWDC